MELDERVAKAIFDSCKEEGVEEIHFDEEWCALSEETKGMYLKIATKAISEVASGVR